MKFLFASDIHGSAFYTKELLYCFEREQADRLVLLGDLLYHGPRNDLSLEYDTRQVAQLLNTAKDKIIAVRGNCDAEIDQCLLEFPMMAEYAVLPVGEHLLYLTHGHRYNEETPLPMMPGDWMMNGHFHVPYCHERNGFRFLNPGSISLPKENSWHGYILWDGNTFLWKDVMGKEMLRWEPTL